MEGGENPAEAVAAGKPVVFGPNMENFASLAAQLVREGGALRKCPTRGNSKRS